MIATASQLLLLCRPGFEKECLAEVTAAAAQQGLSAWARLEPTSGMVLLQCEQAIRLYRHMPALVFAREYWPVLCQLTSLPEADRISPVLQALNQNKEALSDHFGQVFCDYAEGDAYRSTARFAGKFVHPLRQALRRQGWLGKAEQVELPALHLFFPDSHQAFLGVDQPQHRPAWPMGVARLKFPAAAPSRSTLKLEEAFRVFLGPQWRQRLQQAHTAVDLGAAPGGWTWQLVRQDIMVSAIDNGPMEPGLMATGLVEHHRADGFSWAPEHPVDWLVCDMVEQPDKVAHRILYWLQQGWTRHAIFNLKLPMKKRWQSWQDIRQNLLAGLEQMPEPYQLSARQLYFDREEITLCIVPGDSGADIENP